MRKFIDQLTFYIMMFNSIVIVITVIRTFKIGYSQKLLTYGGANLIIFVILLLVRNGRLFAEKGK